VAGIAAWHKHFSAPRRWLAQPDTRSAAAYAVSRHPESIIGRIRSGCWQLRPRCSGFITACWPSHAALQRRLEGAVHVHLGAQGKVNSQLHAVGTTVMHWHVRGRAGKSAASVTCSGRPSKIARCISHLEHMRCCTMCGVFHSCAPCSRVHPSWCQSPGTTEHAQLRGEISCPPFASALHAYEACHTC
jgi:hypothetical protein